MRSIRVAGANTFRWFLAALFVVASAQKVIALPTYNTWFNGLRPSQLLAAVSAEWEFVLAVWLIYGYARSFLWWTLLGTFSMFAAHNVAMILAGASACGCFPYLRLPVVAVLVLDGACLIALVLFRRPFVQTSARGRPTAFFDSQ